MLHQLNSLICYNNYYVDEKYQNKLLNWISWLSWFIMSIRIIGMNYWVELIDMLICYVDK